MKLRFPKIYKMRSTKKRDQLMKKMAEELGYDIWSKILERSLEMFLKYIKLKKEKTQEIEEIKNKWEMENA